MRRLHEPENRNADLREQIERLEEACRPPTEANRRRCGEIITLRAKVDAPQAQEAYRVPRAASFLVRPDRT